MHQPLHRCRTEVPFFFLQTLSWQQNASDTSKDLFDIFGGDSLCVVIIRVILNPGSLLP